MAHRDNGLFVRLRIVNGVPIIQYPDPVSDAQLDAIKMWVTAWNAQITSHTLEQTAAILRRRSMESKI